MQKKQGSKGKYKYWLTDEGLTLLRGWARDGLTDEQIADKCCIVSSTLYEWKKKYPDFSEALKKGKEVVDTEVENALYQKALAGDTTAMIFWLKNRRPDKWRDKQEISVGNTDDKPFMVDDKRAAAALEALGYVKAE
jgi:hypothetical protein